MSLKPVGPLPVSVYWRRRALLLAPVLVILLVLTMCEFGGSDEGSDQKASDGASGESAQGENSEKEDTSQDGDGSKNNPYRPTPGPSPTTETEKNSEQPLEEKPSQDSDDHSTDSGVCDDSQLRVTLSPEHTTRGVGEQLKIRLHVENTSSEECTRDTGPGAQEVYAKQGEERVWSSDDCAASSESSDHTLQPGEKLTYWVVWTGVRSAGCPETPENLPAGQYDVYGRVGSLTSASTPVTWQ